MSSRRSNPKVIQSQVGDAGTIALEAIDRFARVLALSGMPREQMTYALHDACVRAHNDPPKFRENPDRNLVDAAHVLTLWLSDPNYLNKGGEPLRIRPRGPKPSLVALIRRVNSELELDRVVHHLVQTGSITKVGYRYAVMQRNVSFSRSPEFAYVHGLQAVLGLLRTIENNALSEETGRLYFESMAGNQRFPARLRAAFDTRLRRLGMDLLNRLDADMQRAEQSRQPGEPTVCMRVGIFQCDDNGIGASIASPGE